jgi:general stress protein 26
MSRPGEAKSRILEVAGKINTIFQHGTGFEELEPLLHDDAVLVLPGFVARTQGRAACLGAYQDARSQMKIEKLAASDEHVDIWGSGAVLSYKYNYTWEYRGKRLEDEGREIMVFVRNGEDWQLAWRTLVPASRQVEVVSAPEAVTQAGPDGNVRQLCLSIISASLVCDLATIDENGFPHVTTVNNLRCAREYPTLVRLHEESDNPFTIYVSTNMQSHKMARMQANRKVSMSFCDQAGGIGFMLGGEIEIITDQDLKNRVWQKGWTLYYPGGPLSSEYGLIRLRPRMVEGWCRDHRFEIQIPS